MLIKTGLIVTRKATRVTQYRSLTQASVKSIAEENRMQAWQIHSYDGITGLRLSNIRIPIISKPTEVLVKIEAASINPIDIAMANGYGATLIRILRMGRDPSLINDIDADLPLILGRDFSGTIVGKGHSVGEKLNIGDKVWGVIHVNRQGCHAQYVVADSSLVKIRPNNLSYIEAAGVLYAGLTAWSALWMTGQLCLKTQSHRKVCQRILVLGGSGGVGTLAIQLLKAWNMHVVTTCNTDAVEMIEKLGADIIIDYKKEGADEQIKAEGPYEVVLDCCNLGFDRVKYYPYKTYITLNSPLLKNFDQHGVIGGTIKNCEDFFKQIVLNKNRVHWGFFMPCKKGIDTLQNFVERGQILPVIHKVYPFRDLPTAYARVEEGHLRGKVVIDMTE